MTQLGVNIDHIATIRHLGKLMSQIQLMLLLLMKKSKLYMKKVEGEGKFNE